MFEKEAAEEFTDYQRGIMSQWSKCKAVLVFAEKVTSQPVNFNQGNYESVKLYVLV